MMHGPEPHPTRRHAHLGGFARKAVHGLVVFAFLGVAAAFVFNRSAHLDRALRASEAFSPWLLGVAAIAQVLRFVTSGAMVKSSARVEGERLSLSFGAQVFLAATSAGLVLAGVPLTIAASFRWLRDRGLGVGPASLASWLPTTLDNVAFVLPSAIGLIEFTAFVHASPPIAIGSASALAVLVGILGAAYVAVRIRRRAAPALARGFGALTRLVRRPCDEARACSEIGRVLDAAANLGHGRWRRPTGWALATVTLDAVSPLAIFHAAHADTPWLVVIAGFGLPQLVARVTPVPGGVGLVEAGMIATYAALGVPRATTVAVVFGYRLISFWLPRLVGFGLVVWLEQRAGRSNGA